MKGFVPPDPETSVSQEQFAVIYAPRRSRNRFPAACVHPCDSQELALSQANTGENRYAARVLGPSKSSEGQYIYYLIEWIGG